jgi:hypothetical protein
MGFQIYHVGCAHCMVSQILIWPWLGMLFWLQESAALTVMKVKFYSKLY